MRVVFGESWRGVALYGLVYAVLHAASMRFITEGNPLAPLWPPSGVMVAGLLLLRSTPRWRIFLVSFVAGRLDGHVYSWPSVVTLLYFGASCLEGLIASEILRRLRGVAIGFTRIGDVPALLLATVLAVTVNGVLAGLIGIRIGQDFAQAFITSWVGGFLGILLMAPLLVAWVRPSDAPPADTRRVLRALEAIALGLTVVITTRLAFQGVVLFNAVDIPPYALVLPLMWAALRFGLRGVTTVILLMTALATPLQLESHSTVLGGATADVRLLRLQVFIGFMTFSGLVLSAALSEQRAAAAAEAEAAAALVMSERRLRQSQKMEAVGQLAGGIAHDFNNILASMMLQVQEIGTASGLDAVTRWTVTDLTESVERAAALTRQLLLFSRRQAKEERRIDLSDSVRAVTRLLTRIVPESVEFSVLPSPTPLPIVGDASMLEQVVMNLVLNARDAMPSGGTLLVETGSQTLSATAAAAMHAAHPDLPPGEFAVLRVTDSGHGIAAEHLPQLFEPFFTTKDPGKGTGLGLSTVLGIAQQHRGYVRVVTSSPAGTVFELGVPMAEAREAVEVVAATPAPSVPVAAAPTLPETHASSTVLLVEDDADVRRMVQRVLERAGLRVVCAESGREALEHWDRLSPVDLVLTDLVMPGGVSGTDLARALQERSPTLRVVFTSGYDPEVGSHGMVLERGVNFIPKPSTAAQILEVILRRLRD